MSKRFIDDKIWSDPWFQELDPLLKLFWIYLFSICDIVGIWEYNPKRAEFDLCKKLPWEEIQKKLNEKVLFTDRFWIIKTFIKQQYPKLACCPNSPLHISVMKQINKMCLNFDLNSLSIDYSNPIDRVQVKVIVKEEVKVKEKKKEKHRYGEYKHVLLTADELERLKADFGEINVKEMIKNLDEGIQMKGYKYNDHNLTLRKWEKKNDFGNRSQPTKQFGRVDLTPESFKKQMEYVFKDELNG
jgi:hypothetical protein